MKKLFFLLSMMSSIMSPCSAYAADGGTSGDEKNRLFLQADMGKYAPFTKDFLIHTHNSYNNDEDWYVDRERSPFVPGSEQPHLMML